MAAATSLQMSLQHSPRKKNFGYEETIRLLELWTHYTNGGTHPELGKGHRTGRLWLVISERMKAMNYNRGPEECKVRVGNLRAKYTKLKRGYLAGEFILSNPVISNSPHLSPQYTASSAWRFLCVYSGPRTEHRQLFPFSVMSPTLKPPDCTISSLSPAFYLDSLLFSNPPLMPRFSRDSSHACMSARVAGCVWPC